MASVEWILLANDVTVRPPTGGANNVYTVDIKGAGWTGLYLPSFPARLETMGVAWAFRQTHHSVGIGRDFDIDVVDPRGKSLHPGGGPFLRGRFNTAFEGVPDAGEDVLAPFGAVLPDVTFQEPGVYYVVLRANGGEIGRVRFRVQLHPQASTASPPADPPTPAEAGSGDSTPAAS